MIVAEIQISTGSFSQDQLIHAVRFSDLVRAESEFERLKGLLESYQARANDKPLTIEVIGDGNRLSCPLGDVRSIGLGDYAKQDAEMAGVRDAFPNIFKR